MSRFFGTVLCAALAAGLPAQAASVYSIACENGEGRQTVREGTGTREQMLGMGSIPMWCPSAKAIQSHRIGIDGPAYDMLRQIAAMPVGDEVLVTTRVEWRDDDTPAGEATRTAIGWNKERTFGDLRRTLAGLAQPTGDYVDDTGFRYYRADGCSEPLVPVRYYIATKTPFPGCGGGQLTIEGGAQSVWGD